MHGYVLSGDIEVAEGMFESLEDGHYGDIHPGATCFNSMILGCIEKQKWEEAFSWYNRMIGSGVEPLPSSYSGLLIASLRLGGRERTLSLLKGMSTANGRISGETVQLALKLMIPELAREESYHDMRNRIRQMIDQGSESREHLLALTIAIREAENEENKEVYHNSHPHRDSNGWHIVLSALVKVMEAQNEAEVSRPLTP